MRKAKSSRVDSPGEEGYLFYQNRKKLPLIARAEGVMMWDQEGRQYIDACSGAMIVNIGYGNQLVSAAIAEQAKQTFFAYRTQFENAPALELARRMVQCSAPHLNRVFFVSGGSEAVETAMKICRQYFYCRGEGGRHLFISRVPSYHGCTLGALALTGYASLEAPFRPLIKAYPKIPAPYCYRCAYGLTYPQCDLACARELEKLLLELGPQNVAAFVAEPIGGASTGAVVPPDDYFEVIQSICRKFGILLILDEVMTGFGRTGKLFAYEHWNIKADVIALSKGMASGYYPLGAIMTGADIVEEVLRGGGFAHGHTYAGNPMACTVGLTVLNFILEQGLSQNAARMGTILKSGLQQLTERFSSIGQVRGKGLLLGLELVADRSSRLPFAPEMNMHTRLADAAAEEGLIIYPRRPINGLSGDHVVIAPPLIVSAAEIDEILTRLERALARIKTGDAQNKGGHRE